MTDVQCASIAQLAYQTPQYVEGAWKEANGQQHAPCPAPQDTDVLDTQADAYQQNLLDILKDVPDPPVFSNEPSTDADCYMFVWQGFGVISYRGTSSLLDCCMDCDVRLKYVAGLGRVHEGFLHDFESLRKHTDDFAKRNAQLLIVGHSKGGADSTVASAVYGEHSKVTNITFGSPRVGDSVFVKRHKASVTDSRRVVHARDPVAACIPPVIYQHVVSLLHIGDTDPSPDSFDPIFIGDHDIKNYITCLQNSGDPSDRLGWVGFINGCVQGGSAKFQNTARQLGLKV